MRIKNLARNLGEKFRLTAREHEVLGILVSGTCRPADIADILKLCPSTVNNHLKNIFLKTGCAGKTELIAAILASVEERYLSVPARRRQVMLLDDEQDMILMLKNLLELNGMDCHSFTDPELASHQIRKLSIDLIIADYMMPKMNGLEFLTEIRKMHENEPKIIFVSGNHSIKTRDMLLGAGALEVVPKPISMGSLLEKIAASWDAAYPLAVSA